MENTKYKLDENGTIEHQGVTLYRIIALKDIGDMVKKGDRGGYIEKERNLCHKNNSWVGDEAKVYGNAHIWGCGQVFGRACVFGDVQVFDDAMVYGDAQVDGDVCISGNTQIFSNTTITDAEHEQATHDLHEAMERGGSSTEIKKNNLIFKLTIGDNLVSWHEEFADAKDYINLSILCKKVLKTLGELSTTDLLNELKSRGGHPAALAEAALLCMRKSEDYNGGGIDNSQYFPFGAISYAQMLHVKATRFNALVRKDITGEKPNYEGLRDTALDIINYAGFYIDSVTYD